VRIGTQVYGVEQYKETYHRPDIMQRAIALGNKPLMN